MKHLKFPFLALLFAGLFSIAFYSCKKQAVEPTVTSDAKPLPTGKTYYGTPTLSCAGSTLESIDLTFTAGTNGAPAGFSIQWMTKDAFNKGADGVAGTSDDGIWPEYTAANTDINGDPIAASFCKASFSGNAYMSRYNLKEGEGVTVTIGDLLMDNGASASTGCNSDLVCGTDYVFRAFSHGDSKMNRSAFTIPNTCSTLPCPGTGVQCIHGSLGYYKNLAVTSWPGYIDATSSLTIGGVTYTYAQLLAILNYADGGNGYVILAHQYIPALLNKLSGADYSGNVAGFAAAEVYFSGITIPSTSGGASIASNTAKTLVAGINKGNHTCH